jgi:hypothetical protein
VTLDSPAEAENSQLLQTGVGVEKLHFLQNSRNLGDRKCLGKLRKSFVGHPDAILFLRISRERVFQHPRLISSLIMVSARPAKTKTPAINALRIRQHIVHLGTLRNSFTVITSLVWVFSLEPPLESRYAVPRVRASVTFHKYTRSQLTDMGTHSDLRAFPRCLLLNFSC